MKATPSSRVCGVVTGVICVVAGALVGGGSRLPDAAAAGVVPITIEQTGPATGPTSLTWPPGRQISRATR